MVELIHRAPSSNHSSQKTTLEDSEGRPVDAAEPPEVSDQSWVMEEIGSRSSCLLEGTQNMGCQRTKKWQVSLEIEESEHVTCPNRIFRVFLKDEV